MHIWPIKFWQGTKYTQQGKDNLFNKWCWGNWIFICKQIKLDPCFTPHIKINSKWIKDEHKPRAIKLEENTGGKLLDIGPGNAFLDLTPKAKASKIKNKQVGLHQTEKLLHSKGNHQQNKKATYDMGENICKPYIWYGVNIKNTQGTHTT